MDNAMEIDEETNKTLALNTKNKQRGTKIKNTKNNTDIPWVEKYRPERLEDLVAHEDIIYIITKLIDESNLPHLLLYGPPGTGKTSTIIAAAKRMYGPSYSSMTLELNASDARGIDTVRNEIKEFAGTTQLFFSPSSSSSSGAKRASIKLIILDEADAMTSDAQFALRRIMEKYTKNTRFCFICNYVSKIIPALQSRCTRFRFSPLSNEQIHGRLVHVVDEEKCEYEENGLDAILALSNGDMRRVLNLLQSTAMASKIINQTNVYLTSGAPLPSDINTILNHLFNSSFISAFQHISSLCTVKGYALMDVIKDITTLVTAMDLPPGALADILDGMSTVEYHLAFGTDEKIQTSALVGVFAIARAKMVTTSNNDHE